MKLKVTLTRQPNFDIDDFDFLTEALLQEASEINNLRALLKQARKALARATTDNEKRQATNDIKKLEELLARALAVKTASNSSKQAAAATEKIQTTVNKLGGISGMFQWLLDQIAKIPGWMQSIGGRLKGLWGKIKGWMTKFHIIDRAKTLSKLTIACVGFVAAMISTWLHGIIFGKDSRQRGQARQAVGGMSGQIDYLKNRLKHPEQYVSAAETAVFIETFGEILREDNNGGMLVSMARKALDMSSNKAAAVYTACKNSANSTLKTLTGTLKSIVGNARVALGGAPTTENTIPSRFRRRLYNETAFAFDDSLTSFYESIILEAQAHKLKEIKKKAKKKVAIKQAKAKRSLRGRI